MFSRKFQRDHKVEKITHHAISFMSHLPKEEVITKLMKMGVETFVTADNVRTVHNMYDMNFTPYEDNRIVGTITIHQSSQCCSFTKNSQRWYLFPIHDNYLKNTGYDADDMLKWIKYLNDMKAGFEYCYLGKHEALKEGIITNNFAENKTAEGRTFHWILVPGNPAGIHFKKNYLHWIFLRYLLNTTHSTQNMHMYTNMSKMTDHTRLPYYCIPRITMMLNEDYKVPKLKALMYAHLANPFYYYYGFIASDQYVLNDSYYKADVSVKAAEFKRLMCEDVTTGANTMLSIDPNNSARMTEILGRKPVAPYLPHTLFKLFADGDYAGFLKHIKESYDTLKPKKTTKKSKKNVKVSK